MSKAYQIVLTLGMRENADLCALPLLLSVVKLANTLNRKSTTLQLEHHIFCNNLWYVRSSLKNCGFFSEVKLYSKHMA